MKMITALSDVTDTTEILTNIDNTASDNTIILSRKCYA